MGWEGVEARRKGVELNVFKLGDYKISYGYAPVLVARADSLRQVRPSLCVRCDAASGEMRGNEGISVLTLLLQLQREGGRVQEVLGGRRARLDVCG